MKKTRLTKILSLILCIVLTAAMTLFTIGCSDDESNKETPQKATEVTTTVSSQTDGSNDGNESNHEKETIAKDENTLGVGEKTFKFTVVDANGKETSFTINTDKKTVGDALLDVGLIAGEEGPYGLYVKTVNGITVDFDKDGKYWAFYVDGEYAMTGVDATDIKNDTSYAFKVE